MAEEQPAVAVLLRRESDRALSAEGWAIYSEVRREVPAAYVDLAQLGFCSPATVGDPDNHRLKAAALAAVWRTYRAAGSQVLVLCGRVDTGVDVQRYAEAVAGVPLAVFETPSSGDVAAIVQDVRDRLRLR